MHLYYVKLNIFVISLYYCCAKVALFSVTLHRNSEIIAQKGKSIVPLVLAIEQATVRLAILMKIIRLIKIKYWIS